MVYEAAVESGLPRTIRRFDLVFAGLFPWLTPLDGERRTLRPRSRPPIPSLAAQAEASLLVRHASAEREAAARVRLPAGGTAEEHQLEVWARLLAGSLRDQVEAEQKDAAYYSRQSPLEAIFPLTAHLMEVHLAGRPFPMLLPALPIAAATHDLTGPRDPSGALLTGVRTAMTFWTTAGVLTSTTRHPATPAHTPARAETGTGTEIRELVTLFWRDDDASPDPAEAAARFLRQIPRHTLGLILTSPPVQLTPLGAYGIRRLLLAHNWTIDQPTDTATES
ncbi:hypothetical protein Nocox_38490 [Nonomuraea coxensis DSM 45129]|uniref:Uncharacterized protein n=1 Tax=Nonomuraea coxensis DSM 45129 TaxID=1122611 RepID=A0ABX8UBV4_9ACTN|nr:hypothetical protein [Nonomuraea coxensis]QYC45248.1 hypothetical protein Nocox_38490 [Nonomuraea coxensis DSM 45129]